jgi:hypothetical protein
MVVLLDCPLGGLLSLAFRKRDFRRIFAFVLLWRRIFQQQHLRALEQEKAGVEKRVLGNFAVLEELHMFHYKI